VSLAESRPSLELPPHLAHLTRVSVAGYELVLFEEAPELIDAMVCDLRTASQRIWLESYIIAADAAGQEIADVLLERAAQGVDVRVMYDSVGSVSTPTSFFERLSEGGVKVHGYRTLRATLSRRSFLQAFNRRDHRKLLVVDDTVGYFGGMNIVDQRNIQTVADAKARHLPVSAGWRDLHVRMTGPQQADLAEAFDQLWRRVHRLKRGRQKWPLDRLTPEGEDLIAFFDCRPAFRKRQPARVYVPLLRQARHDITVLMAYFIPVGRVLREFVRARRRGVRVRVVIPEQSDVRLVRWATRHFYSFLLRRGFQIYERKDRMLHSKVMVIDDRWSIVGSCNLDPRSLRLNLELIAAIRSRAMATAVKRICRYEIQHSERITLAHWHKRTWLERIGDRIAWSLRRWL